VSVRLQVDPFELPQVKLDRRFLDAIQKSERAQRQMRKAQAGGSADSSKAAPSWKQTSTNVPYLELSGGAVFVPDGQDKKSGVSGIIFGALASAVGIWLAVASQSPKGTDALLAAAATALLCGGVLWAFKGIRMKRVAKDLPKRTGTYLFDDVLVQVMQWGCRAFPKRQVLRFEYVQEGHRSPHLLIHYEMDSGQPAKEVLLYRRDASALLGKWLDKRRRAGQPARRK